MAHYPDLVGKTAIVTGGSVGIGEAICRAFAVTGVQVAVVARRNREAAERVAAECTNLGVKSFALLADVSQSPEVRRMVDEVTQRLGPIDILVNNAGGFPARRAVVAIGDEEWDEIIDVNLRSCFLCTRAVLPKMMERGWGRIINVASEAGRMPLTTTAAHYAAAKAGVIGFTKHVAREAGPHGVTVNATAPSTTFSPRVRRVLDAATIEKFAGYVPLGRLAEPSEQAGIVVFLTEQLVLGALIHLLAPTGFGRRTHWAGPTTCRMGRANRVPAPRGRGQPASAGRARFNPLCWPAWPRSRPGAFGAVNSAPTSPSCCGRLSSRWSSSSPARASL